MATSNDDLDAVELYWRPGCGFCSSLERQLRRAGIPLERRNIWEDPEAAAFVRAADRGNETVPTVAVGEVTLVNPSGPQVVAAVAESAPHLLPEGTEVPQLNRFQRTVRRLLGG